MAGYRVRMIAARDALIVAEKEYNDATVAQHLITTGANGSTLERFDASVRSKYHELAEEVI